MRMRGLIVGVALVLPMLAANPALAQVPSVAIPARPSPPARDAEFTVGRTVFTVPVPEGYCIEGEGIDAYLRQQRAKGPDEVPDLVMMPCDQRDRVQTTLFVVLVRRQTGANNQRANLLAGLARTMPVTPGEPDLSAEPGETIAERIGSRLVRRVGGKPGVGALGVDEMCAYVGGRIAEANGTEASGAGCMTVIGGYIVLVSRYRTGRVPAEVAATIPEVKAMALSITTR